MRICARKWPKLTLPLRIQENYQWEDMFVHWVVLPSETHVHSIDGIVCKGRVIPLHHDDF
jgi:hypothetical protein